MMLVRRAPGGRILVHTIDCLHAAQFWECSAGLLGSAALAQLWGGVNMRAPMVGKQWAKTTAISLSVESGRWTDQNRSFGASSGACFGVVVV